MKPKSNFKIILAALFWISVLALVALAYHKDASAQIFDGQPVNAATTNNAFVKRNINDTMSGIFGLVGVAAGSGASVTNLQRELNACSSYTGKTLNGVYNELPAWTHNDVGSSSDTLKARADALTFKFNASSGHTHTGAAGDAPQISNSGIASGAAIARSKIAAGALGKLLFNNASTGLIDEETSCTIAQGCTGQVTAAAGFDALAPTTTKGDTIVRSGSTNSRFTCPDGQQMQWDSGQTLGVKCVTPASTSGFAASGANADITSMSAMTGAIESPTRIKFTQISTPSTPAAGFDQLYFKSDDHLYKKNSAGVETQVDQSSSGSITTDTKVTDYTINVGTDANKYFAFNCPTDCTITFPDCTSSGSYKVDIINVGAATVNIISAVTDTFNGADSMSIAPRPSPYFIAQTIVCYGGTSHYVH